MLHTHREVHSTYQIWRCLCRPCRSYRDKIWYIKLGSPETEKYKKVIGLMKYGLSGRIMKEFIALIPKMCSYVTDDG